MIAIVILITLACILTTIDALCYLIAGKHLFGMELVDVSGGFSMLVSPILFFLFDEKSNDCCSDSASFSPEHRLTVYIWVSLCVVAYCYSSFRKHISPPIIEVITNALLLFGFILNAVIFAHVYHPLGLFSIIGNLPIGLLFLVQLSSNHKKFLEANSTNTTEKNGIEKYAWGILRQNIFVKIPILFVLCLPFLFLVTALLLLFGQKPDSIIRAFTDTYKHGFSQLDHLCNNVLCGGHFLCSVAANGHRKIVKPIRYGERNGNKIICNRQLLIANAFEELVQQKLPKGHKVIRRQYNKIGDSIHQHYHVFNNKYISDLIYISMKPLEAFFLLALYTFDKKPEDRIASQYLKRTERNAISEKQASY